MTSLFLVQRRQIDNGNTISNDFIFLSKVFFSIHQTHVLCRIFVMQNIQFKSHFHNRFYFVIQSHACNVISLVQCDTVRINVNVCFVLLLLRILYIEVELTCFTIAKSFKGWLFSVCLQKNMKNPFRISFFFANNFCTE